MSSRHSGFALELEPKDSGLTPAEKGVLVHIAHRTNSETEDCFPSAADIGVVTGYSVETVRKALQVLEIDGWLAIIPRKRPNGSWSSNLYVVNLDKIIEQVNAQKAKKKGGTPATRVPQPVGEGTPATGEGYPSDWGRVPQPLGDHNNKLNNKPNNSLSDAQAQERIVFRDRLIELAGDVLADPARSIHAANPYPLMVLKDGTPNSPACTVEEIEQAVQSAAAWHRGKNRQMVNWELPVKLACELRDKRLAGVPVKPVMGAQAIANPAGWDEEQWRKVIRMARHKGHWPGEYGPEPGADGSLVPAGLLPVWRGEI
jgi:hypothetical protein